MAMVTFTAKDGKVNGNVTHTLIKQNMYHTADLQTNVYQFYL